jgi:NADPH:quinone reductase-like Zn-dependent oxidoreductase
MGLDAAGVVESVGAAVADLRPGDRVFGARGGAFAELVAGRNFVPIPAGLTFEEAAAIPVAGTTALQAVRDHGEVEAGQRVLITGAGGGVGTFAVQIATARGARVTAATSASKAELVRSIGAVDVIDYRAADITRRADRYDVVIDVGGYRRLPDLARLVRPGGTIVAVGPGAGQWIGPLAHMLALRVRDRLGRHRYRGFLARINREDLLTLRGLVESGAIRPVVDSVHPLAEIRTAIARVEAGQAAGKVVIRVAD